LNRHFQEEYPDPLIPAPSTAIIRVMEKIIWARKLNPVRIRQLYLNDARGTVDESLVDAVGFNLYQRCRSIEMVTTRKVECPRCGTVFKLRERGVWKLEAGPQACPNPNCGWETTAAEWHASWQHRDMLGSAAMGAISTYLHDYPLAGTIPQRMVCIDQLIHSFHISLRTGKVSRAFGNNLIEGSHEQVVELLDRLFANDGVVDRELWREEINGMFRRRRGQE
jgi:hypothetical protein